MVPSPWLAVNARAPSAEIAMVCEPFAFVGIDATTSPVATSTSMMFRVVWVVTSAREGASGRNTTSCGPRCSPRSITRARVPECRSNTASRRPSKLKSPV